MLAQQLLGTFLGILIGRLSWASNLSTTNSNQQKGKFCLSSLWVYINLSAIILSFRFLIFDIFTKSLENPYKANINKATGLNRCFTGKDIFQKNDLHLVYFQIKSKPNDDTQNYPFCRLQLVVETFGQSTYWTNQ